MRAASGAAFVLSACTLARAQTVTATAVAGSMPVTCTVGPPSSIPTGTNLAAGATATSQGTGAIGTAHATTNFLPLAIEPYEVRAVLQTDVGAQATLFFSHLGAECGTLFALPYFGRTDVLLGLQAAVPVHGRASACCRSRTSRSAPTSSCRGCCRRAQGSPRSSMVSSRRPRRCRCRLAARSRPARCGTARVRRRRRPRGALDRDRAGGTSAGHVLRTGGRIRQCRRHAGDERRVPDRLPLTLQASMFGTARGK
jgi:hypothetical protein